MRRSQKAIWKVRFQKIYVLTIFKFIPTALQADYLLRIKDPCVVLYGVVQKYLNVCSLLYPCKTKFVENFKIRSPLYRSTNMEINNFLILYYYYVYNVQFIP